MFNPTTIQSAKKIACVFAAALFFVSGLAALPFNKRLSEDELAELEAGKVLVRNIGSTSRMCLESDNAGAQRILADMKALKPSYLAEIIQIRPYAGNEDLPLRLEDALMNISDYVGIPYYSEQGDTWYDLYSSADIKSDSMREDGITRDVKADLWMDPFGMINTSIEITTPEDYVYYISTNDNALYMRGIRCVREKNMKSAVLLFRDGDNWILYGAGGVDAARIIFFQRRIEVSFINRIKTFCNFIFEKL